MQTIVFDFGNVIGYFDHERTLKRLAQHSDLSVAQMRAAVYDTPLEDAYEVGEIATADFLIEVHKRWRLRCDHDELAAAWADIFSPNPELCPIIPRLKRRYRLLLGSNTNDLHSRHFRRQFADTLGHFDSLILSHEIGVRKPKAGFFHHCQKQAGASPEQCLFIDDMAENVAGAEACGWRGIVFRDCRDLEARLNALGILTR
jgi:glucose-1-phosphatase